MHSVICVIICRNELPLFQNLWQYELHIMLQQAEFNVSLDAWKERKWISMYLSV